MDNEKRWITLREAAQILRITMHYVYTLIWERKLTAKKVGRRWAIDHESVMNYKRAAMKRYKVKR